MAVVSVNEKDFEQEVLNSKGIVLVDFNATWCGPCKMLGPIIEELSDEKTDVKFVSVDVDENEELSSEYGVMSIPCVVLFKDGKEINRNVGFMQREELEEFIGGK